MANVVLFFWPISFYSQRARLSLEEKRIPYKEVIINYLDRDQLQPWFLKINPNGEVPTIKLGDEYFWESENIVDIVDRIPSGSSDKLVPSLDTPEGKLVSEWRNKIKDLNTGVITHGSVVNREFSDEGIHPMLSRTREDVTSLFKHSIEKAQTLSQQHPELKASCDRKILIYQGKLATYVDKECLRRDLNSLDYLLDQIEQHLKKMASENQGECWMCGKTFTAADINLCVLLGRLTVVGHTKRFTDTKKYPNLASYWTQAKARPTVQKVVLNNLEEVKKYMITKKVCYYTSRIVGVGAVAAVTWFVYKHVTK